MQVARLAMPVHAQFRDRALSRKPPDPRLCGRPYPPRPKHRLVVKTDRQQPVHPIEQSENIPVRGRPARLSPNLLPRYGISDARTGPRLAIDVDHAVWTVTSQAIQTPRTVILERPSKHPHSAPVKRRCHRVTRHNRNSATLKVKCHVRRAEEPSMSLRLRGSPLLAHVSTTRPSGHGEGRLQKIDAVRSARQALRVFLEPDLPARFPSAGRT